MTIWDWLAVVATIKIASDQETQLAPGESMTTPEAIIRISGKRRAVSITFRNPDAAPVT